MCTVEDTQLGGEGVLAPLHSHLWNAGVPERPGHSVNVGSTAGGKKSKPERGQWLQSHVEPMGLSGKTWLAVFEVKGLGCPCFLSCPSVMHPMLGSGVPLPSEMFPYEPY